jgi:hypothetical protein
VSRKEWGYDKRIATSTRDVPRMPGESGDIMPLARERAKVRISQADPYAGLIRNKGARKGKGYVTSDHPGGAEMTSVRRSKANDRMKARRKAARAAKQEAHANRDIRGGLPTAAL